MRQQLLTAFDEALRAWDERPGFQVLLIGGMLLVFLIPVAITLSVVSEPPQAAYVADTNPTPYGYTLSLLIFFVPCAATLAWHRSRWGGNAFDTGAFIWTAGIMAVVGTVLDILFGYHFFQFRNESATLGVRIPAFDWATMGFVPDYLPLEEFAFYVLGAIFMVAMYLWADLNWLSRYDPDLRDSEDRKLVAPSWQAGLVWVVLLALGFLGKQLASDDGWFPGYYVFLMGLGLLPALLLYRTVSRHLNWHAFTFAFMLLLSVSLMWETTLGVAYGWWEYKPQQMMGVFIHAWRIPVEAVIMWLVGAWTAIMMYEAFRILFRRRETGEHSTHILFGRHRRS